MYEFECVNCHHKSEKIVKIGTEEIECGECGGQAVKIVSLPADPQFHGSGWTPKFHGSMGKPQKRP